MMRHLLSVRTNQGQQEAPTWPVDTVAKVSVCHLMGIGLEPRLRPKDGLLGQLFGPSTASCKQRCQ